MSSEPKVAIGNSLDTTLSKVTSSDPVTDKKLEKPVPDSRTPLSKAASEPVASKVSLLTSTTGTQPEDGAAVWLVGE